MAVQIPTFDSLRTGYGKTVQHAISLAAASGDVAESRTGTRLALAELAQEEVGKSFSLLAAMAIPEASVAVWKRFWNEFRNHDVKCARAFFYEWFEPTRISIVMKDGSTPDGVSRFKQLSRERTYGFYVDYDTSTGQFVAPGDRVRPDDLFNRIAAVVSLAEKASALHTILTDQDVEFSLREWGKLAHRLCTEFTYQQDMPGVLDTFAAQSPRHRELRDRVDYGLRLKADALRAMMQPRGARDEV